MKVLSVVGTRPNLMKMAPVVAALDRRGVDQVLVHTGQHYDDAMSDIFFRELGMREPDHFLGVGAGTHAEQTARTMERLEPVLIDARPDLVLVPGDVNSTLAAALVASKLEVPVGHVEAGLRSFDRSMPEELNRVLTDAVSDLLFIHSPEAGDNLLREGRPASAIHYVGNTMIDTLVAMRDRIAAEDAASRRGLDAGSYLVVTLHRPALVDGPLLADAIAALREVAAALPVVFPMHPRTRASLRRQGIDAAGIDVVDPVGYLEFLSLVETSAGVLTDSGGIQEETTFLGVPCFTLRDNTERPITVEAGTNTLLGLRPERIREIPGLVGERRPQPPRYWDGSAAERVAEVVCQSDIRRRSCR